MPKTNWQQFKKQPGTPQNSSKYGLFPYAPYLHHVKVRLFSLTKANNINSPNISSEKLQELMYIGAGN